MAQAKVVINGDSKDAQKAMSNLEKKTDKLRSTMKKAAKVAAVGLAGGIAAIGTAAGKAIKDTIDYADTIDKTSQRMGIATETAQEWKFIGEQLGVEFGSLERGLTRFQKRVGEADDGLSSAQRAFENLDINIKNADGSLRSMDDLFPQAIKKLSEMEDVTKRNQLAMELFGRGGKELIPILNQSSGDIESLTKRAHELGLVMSEENVSAGVKLKDTFHEITSAFGGVIREIGAELMPAMQGTADWIIDHMPEIKATIKTTFDAISAIINTTKTVINTLKEVFSSDASEMSESMKNMKESISGILTALKTIINTFIDVISTAWDLFGDDIMRLAETAFNHFKITVDTVLNTVENLISAFASLITGDWEGLTESIDNLWRDLWNGIKAIAENIWDGLLKQPFESLKQSMVNTWTNLITDMKQIGQNIIQGLKDGITGALGSLKDKVKGAAEGVADTVKNFFGIESPSKLFMEYGQSLMEGLALGITQKTPVVKNTIKTLGNNVGDLMKDMESKTTTASDNMADSIVSFVSSVADGSKTFKKAMKEMLLSAITALEKQVIAYQMAATGIAAAMAVWDFGTALTRLAGAMPQILASLAVFETLKAGIQGLAEGGRTLTSGSVLVGEEGPELLNLPAGAQVTPLNKTNNMASTININITGNRISSDMDIDRIGDKMVRKLRMAGVTP